VVFPLLRNSKANVYLETLLANIEKGEGHQVQGLLAEIKLLSHKLEKRENDVAEAEKELRKRNEELERVKRDAENRLSELGSLRRENGSLHRQAAEAREEQSRLQGDLIELRANYEVLVSQRKEVEQFKQLQKVAADNSEELIKFRAEMELKQTPPEALAKSFFEMLQLKNLTLLKAKEKQKEYSEKYKDKEEENVKLKHHVQTLKK
jgi:chromosome segregation ATPase